MDSLDIHSLTHHVSLRAGGVRDAVKGLAKGLTKAGNSFTLYGVRDNPAADDAENYSDLDLQLGITSSAYINIARNITSPVIIIFTALVSILLLKCKGLVFSQIPKKILTVVNLVCACFIVYCIYINFW